MPTERQRHPEQSVTIKFRALGTDIFLEVILNDPGEAERAIEDLEAAKNIFVKKEKIFSRFDPSSEISRLNQKPNVVQKVSRDIGYLSKRALYYNKISGGLYDPRIIEMLEQIGYDKDFRRKNFSSANEPPEFSGLDTDLEDDLKIKEGKIRLGRRMDFSGIAKGYIVDKAAEFLKSKGWKNFLVDAGGDMNLSGTNRDGKRWQIAVEGISEKKLMLEITDCGIATSGISRKKWSIRGKKYHHLVNPKDPNFFSFEVRTVSVIEKNTEEADGRAKTLVLMGPENGLKFAKEKNIAAVFLDYKGNIFLSPAVKKVTRQN